MSTHEAFIGAAVTLAAENVAAGGAPYGAVIVRDGAVLVRAANTVHTTNDPSAHAEMEALREASRILGRRDLSDCVMYASGRPCPMCHAAMRLAGFKRGYFAFSAEEAEQYGAGSATIYAELCQSLDSQPMQLSQIRPDGEAPYAAWRARRRA
ncbi:tRNA(Arg) A34 adenosine deaminase TadA [Methylobacterium phyllostachyos]|uniref:tRNA(Arg) A34 adenosine deaminase TadA n=1 Tax=Methylobacterium phyllostachyos TaxID=582672 RepID=A0A1G9R996_9HYPH|nr:nucleoside deaminase [Methylobacterium phyllostachyos]SDM19721.1 tRNA(Arg) A34 adenosine deaminase TadA [Methylobacterium phyllostachyos]